MTAVDPGTVGTFGPLVHSASVDKAVISFLIKWLPTWLTASEQRVGKPTRWLGRPARWTTTYAEDDDDFFSDHKLPAVIVTSGEFTDWLRTGAQDWSATCRVAITYVSRGRSMPETRAQSAIAIATITDLLLSKPGMDGFSNGVIPISERPRPLEDPSNRSRHLGAGMGQYDVFVPNIRKGLMGPLAPDPPDDPDQVWSPYPPISEVDIAIDGFPPPTLPEE